MDGFQIIYERNKELDKIFITRYQKDEPFYFEKNCIGFLVELGELINETKCFKYWTIKKPKKDLVLEEYADCLISTLTFYYALDMNLDEELVEHQKTDNILEIINYLYQECTKIMKNMNESLLRDILSNLMYLGELLDLSHEEIIDACQKKQDIIEERLNSDY